MTGPAATPRPYVILAAVDFSETSDLALLEAFRQAKSHPRAEVHVVHVASPYTADSVYLESFGAFAGTRIVPAAQAEDNLREQVERRLRDFQSGECGDESPFDRLVLHFLLGQPANTIAQLASDIEADLVVIGTHGRTGAMRVLMGSVAEATVRRSPCPVLVVRPRAPANEAPAIDPPCPRCVETRRETGGAEFWCEQHRERHGRRHTYRVRPLTTRENMPLLLPMDR